MAYSSIDDLLLGDLPLSRMLSREKFVDDAADEIDSYIGPIYVTPVDVSDGGPVARHSRLLLKRINNFLASGRLILAIAAGGEDTALHAYGLKLVNEALAAIAQIANGGIDIEGAEQNDVPMPANDGPTIYSPDAASAVDAFYNRVMTPETGYATGLPYRDWAPGDDPTGAAVV